MRTLNFDNEILGNRALVLRTLPVHLVLCLIIYFSPTYAIFIPIIPFLAIKFYRENKHEYVLLAGVYALCCKNESVFYPFAITLTMFLLLNKKRSPGSSINNTIITRFLQLSGFLVLTYVLQLFNDGSLFSLPFFILTFFSPIVVLLYIIRTNISAENIRKFVNELLSFAIAQIIVTFFIQAVPRGIGLILEKPTMGDFITGTTNSSNLLGFLLCASILPFVMNFILGKRKANKYTAILCMLMLLFFFMIHLSDAKSRLYAFILSALIIFGLKKVIFNKRVDLSLLYVLGIACLCLFCYNMIMSYTDSLYIKYIDYITGKSNAKLEYYKRVFSWNTRSLIEYIIGTGPGTNGSRSANTLASDVLYKSDLYSVKLPSFISPKSNDFTKEHLAKLYTPEYAMTTSERSALLGNPFNSVCAIFVEFGILGTILFARFIYPLYKYTIKRNDILSIGACVLLFVSLILGTIDQSFETAMIMYFMYLYMGLSISAGRLIKQKQSELTLVTDDKE